MAQSGLASFGSAVAYYAYRDGTALARPSDGLGAMRFRTRAEEALLRSVELREITARRMATGRAAVTAAKAAIARAQAGTDDRL